MWWAASLPPHLSRVQQPRAFGPWLLNWPALGKPSWKQPLAVSLGLPRLGSSERAFGPFGRVKPSAWRRVDRVWALSQATDTKGLRPLVSVRWREQEGNGRFVTTLILRIWVKIKHDFIKSMFRDRKLKYRDRKSSLVTATWFFVTAHYLKLYLVTATSINLIYRDRKPNNFIARDRTSLKTIAF